LKEVYSEEAELAAAAEVAAEAQETAVAQAWCRHGVILIDYPNFFCL
jgi:hypothetical protein